MKLEGSILRLSATDLANHLGCRHCTQLDRALAMGEALTPGAPAPGLDVLAERGLRHEKAYLDHLRSQGHNVLELPQRGGSLEQTLAAMRSGSDVIAQATLADGRWLGVADVLRRVEIPSALGAFSYVPEDTKLSQETRAGAVLQLCLYADLLDKAQGVRPETIAVISPGKSFAPDTLRVADFWSYFRFVKARLEKELAGATPTEAEPVDHCEVCRWWSVCDAGWHASDHLSLVANLSRSQRLVLRRNSVPTLVALAQVPSPPWPWKPERGSCEALEKAREQARVQLTGRTRQTPYHELLPPEPGRGLALLPAPDPADVFFDFEGDPFFDFEGRAVSEGGGLEYLFGWVNVDTGTPRYERLWALDRAAERRAFDGFMGMLTARWARSPAMHVYHFAAYEPSHLKILAQRHALRMDELDAMLRGGLFVDLFTAVRQGLRASVESYSIKKLEAFYGFERDLALDDAGQARRAVERALELGDDPPSAETLEWVALYNRDDCVSTWRLRDWLEGLRAGLVGRGEDIPRPEPRDSRPKDELAQVHAQTKALQDRLLSDVSADPKVHSREERARWLLTQLLDFHRREGACEAWEFYRLVALDPDEALDERKALGGLVHLERRIEGKTTIDRYQFPAQDSEIKVGDTLKAQAEPGLDKAFTVGVVAEIDDAASTVTIRRGRLLADLHPAVVFESKRFDEDEQEAALRRLAAWVLDHGVDNPGPHRAARDLLLRLKPRGWTPGTRGTKGVLQLDQGVLPIQGPPGTGKTYAAAEIIVGLVKAGKRVGVIANSHKVIDHLLVGTQKAGEREGRPICCGHKTPDETPEGIRRNNVNATVRAWLADAEVEVLGGTSYMWAREEFERSVDVLVVDEAGQLSLANVLAAAQAADTLVFVGDPQQLAQPAKATHPDGCAVSALEHLLDGAPTISENRGLFLPETRRLHPDICRFTSEVFYRDQLHALPGLDRQSLGGSDELSGSGLRLLLVDHAGNRSDSKEEVDAIERLVSALTSDRTWTDRHGTVHPLTSREILIVAPYNAQVSALRRRLPGLHIGTVDKFQGQEAPVVIVSMTSSSAQDAPRGMEFLYSPNRLNVATSRAQCACFLVASPALFEPECRTPHQMRLANALCRYRELARAVEL